MARPPGLILPLALAALLPAAARAEVTTFATSSGEPTVRWAIPVGDVDADPDEIDGIGIGPDGTVVVTGVFRGNVDIGPQTFASQGEGDIFLASLDAGGNLRWSRQIGAGGDDNAFDLQVDGAGNAVLSGWFSGAVDFGGAALQSRGATDMFVAKYDPEGRLLWARSYGGPAGDGGNELAVLSGGDIAVSLITEGDVEIAGQAYPFGGGERDSYVLRLDRDGNVLWVAPAAGPGMERIRAMSMNESGEVFVGFQYRGSVTLGGQTMPSQGDWDGALAKLTPGGALAWMMPVGGQGTDSVRGVAAAPDGAVYAAGVFEGPAFLFSREVPAIGRRGDDYLVRLSGDGQPQWVVSAGGPGATLGPEIRADERGVVASSVVNREITIRRNRDVVGQFAPSSGQATSYLAAFSPRGEPRFVYTTDPQGRGSGAFGDVLALSRDGRYLAQVLRFRGTLEAGGREMRTASERDSIIILMDLNGA